MTLLDKQKTVVGVFDSRQTAVDCVNDLHAAGYSADRVGLISPGVEFAEDPVDDNIETGMGVGAAAGGLSGLGLGLAVAAGAIPAVGPVILGGTLAAPLASTIGAAAAGSVVGGLVGLGISENDVTSFEMLLRSGHSLVTIKAEQIDAAIESIVNRHGWLHTSTLKNRS